MTMTGAERARALRERRRRGLRKVSVEIYEDDLREIALRGYEGAASSDRTLQAEAVTLCLTDTLIEKNSATSADSILYQMSGSTEISVGGETKTLKPGEGLLTLKPVERQARHMCPAPPESRPLVQPAADAMVLLHAIRRVASRRRAAFASLLSVG